MKPSVRRLVAIVYYFSQVLGLVAFSFNYKTGRIKTKFYITLYCAVVSVLMFGTVPLLFRMEWKPRDDNGPDLHYKITSLMCLIRILAVLITIILNWMKRKEFIRSIKDFQRLRRILLRKFQMSPKVKQYFERGVAKKFYWSLMSNILIFLTSYDILKSVFNVQSPVIILGICIVATVLNVIMTHYYFALLNINALLAVINEELKGTMHAAAKLFKLQRLKSIKPGGFMTECCQLSDKLDDLALLQFNFQCMAERVNKMYEIQGACVLLTLYLNNISVTYTIYMVAQHEQVSQQYGWILVFIYLPISLTIYYTDLYIFIMNVLKSRDLVKETAELLKGHQPYLPTLDARLERSLKDFSIQLASFPLQMKILGLFEFNRSTSFATFGSTISNSIILMQYDYKYSKD